MKTFWQDLRKPILALAPMEDVTDTVFRRIVARCGRPTVFFTEFTSCDGLQSVGYEYVAKRLQYTEKERPLIAQIWGTKPENYYKTAKLLVEQGFDGIDLNMGCPDKSVIKIGACSALIKDPSRAKEIIQATKEAAGDLPVSVKTRIGFYNIKTEEWLGFLLEQEIAALSIHGRTVKEASKVPAHWEEIGKGVALRNQMGVPTVIVGNGDVESLQEAEEKAAQYGLEGIMIGRGIFKDPWLFNPEHHGGDIPFAEKLSMLSEHIDLFLKTWGTKKNFMIMRKFFKCYINGVDNASEYRQELMECKTSAEIQAKLSLWIAQETQQHNREML